MQSAAFFRFEGTFTGRPTIAAAAWLAFNAQHIGQRLARLSNVALATPFQYGGPLRDGLLASKVTWMGLRGISDDRLQVIGEEYADQFLIPNLRDVGIDLVAKARRSGHEPVLISDNLDVIVAKVAGHLGIDDYVCNRLEMRDGRATGRLSAPIIGGYSTGEWARDFAAKRGIDLDGCFGYGAHADDAMLLSALGKPCVVNPDRQLRQIARDLDWPVVQR